MWRCVVVCGDVMVRGGVWWCVAVSPEDALEQKKTEERKLRPYNEWIEVCDYVAVWWRVVVCGV
jgi:hypothetical protein